MISFFILLGLFSTAAATDDNKSNYSSDEHGE
jgi:hypothetical protein